MINYAKANLHSIHQLFSIIQIGDNNSDCYSHKCFYSKRTDYLYYTWKNPVIICRILLRFYSIHIYVSSLSTIRRNEVNLILCIRQLYSYEASKFNVYDHLIGHIQWWRGEVCSSIPFGCSEHFKQDLQWIDINIDK